MTYGILLAEGLLGGNYSSFLMIGAMLVVMYFFMIRPQQKKQKELKNFRESLSSGSEVVTNGGIFGKVITIEDDKVTLEVDRGVKIKVLKSAISSAMTAATDAEKK